jgi:hypothetical protein
MNMQPQRKRKVSEAPSAPIDNSNALMLEDKIRAAAAVCAAVAHGNFNKKLVDPIHGTTMGKLQVALNGMVDKIVMINRELGHVSLDVSGQGILSVR